MKKTLLSIMSISAFAFGVSAQTFAPTAAQGLPAATAGTAYNETINVSDIPSTTTVNIADLGLPAAATGIPGIPQTFDLAVTSVVFTVADLPSGLSSSTATITPGGSDDLTISGTPSAASNSVVNVTSLTSGEADLTAIFDLAGATGAPLLAAAGVTNPYPVPQPVPGLFDESGYDLTVSGGNSIAEANDVFSLGFYPNPTTGDATLEVKTIEGGVATVEVYSITGSRVLSTSESISVGLNRVSVNLNGVPAGIYLIKADINGAQALIRTQKI